MSLERPFSESCERNKEPILAVLQETFDRPGKVLEIGSGTGQHAVYFAAALPHLQWQTSDLPASHGGILAWLEQAHLPNLLPPLDLDVTRDWPESPFDYAFSANTLHIMGWPEVIRFFAGIGETLKSGGRLAVYGPFNYGGEYTSDSNARFDEWLKVRDSRSGIRHFEEVDALAQGAGLRLLTDRAMPANNHILVWEMRRGRL
jgi:cyclopropane fatty-acyl-phospholipid synthase-like methyltransferase